MDSLTTSLPLDALIALRGARAPTAGDSLIGLTHFPGLARGLRHGQGLDFDDLRQYSAGDDVRRIDWNVTARTGRVYTRQYREEREKAITVMVDLRPLMFTGGVQLKAVAAGEMAARLVWAAASRGDRVGLATLTDTIRASRPAVGDRGALHACAALASAFEQGQSLAKAARPVSPDLTIAIEWANAAIRAAGSLVLITGYDQAGAGASLAVREAAQHRRLSIIRLTDRLEEIALPPGRYGFGGTRKPGAVTISTQDQKALQLALDDSDRAINHELASSGLNTLVIRSHTPRQAALATMQKLAIF